MHIAPHLTRIVHRSTLLQRVCPATSQALAFISNETTVFLLWLKCHWPVRGILKYYQQTAALVGVVGLIATASISTWQTHIALSQLDNASGQLAVNTHHLAISEGSFAVSVRTSLNQMFFDSGTIHVRDRLRDPGSFKFSKGTSTDGWNITTEHLIDYLNNFELIYDDYKSGYLSRANMLNDFGTYAIFACRNASVKTLLQDSHNGLWCVCEEHARDHSEETGTFPSGRCTAQ